MPTTHLPVRCPLSVLLIFLSLSLALPSAALAKLRTNTTAQANKSAASASTRVTVSPDGHGDFLTIQQAIDHAPPYSDGRLIIAIQPGIYRERLVVPQDRPRVTFLGLGKDPSATVITYNMSAKAAGGTFLSSTVDVEGSDFEASNLTFENSFGPGSQAVALMLHSDRAVLRHCRFIGWQDTLYSATGREYFDDCYIEGAVDFIFGNARAVFHHCEIRSTGSGYITAQSRTTPDGDYGFVFQDCRLTAPAGVSKVFLGRPWRPYARVVFLHTEMGAHIDSAGWREWHPGETHSLDTSYYAEYDSSGSGGSRAGRDPHTHFLTESQAAQFEPKQFLAAPDGWDPTAPASH
ncbi:MAG TPA: pectinesterase family protein [Candidatus Acidoferrum sp.]|nr:pectinesterase family protein [Candidatus Acidoferrum sp.]